MSLFNLFYEDNNDPYGDYYNEQKRNVWFWTAWALSLQNNH